MPNVREEESRSRLEERGGALDGYIKGWNRSFVIIIVLSISYYGALYITPPGATSHLQRILIFLIIIMIVVVVVIIITIRLAGNHNH